MTYNFILTETRGRVGLITLNRPQVLNALNNQLVREVMDALEKTRGIRRFVLMGLCSGAVTAFEQHCCAESFTRFRSYTTGWYSFGCIFIASGFFANARSDASSTNAR